MARCIIATLMLTLLLCGCSGSSSSHPATLVRVTVTPATSSIAPGTTEQLRASADYSDGSSVDVTGSATWSSGSTGVATINNAGLASGLSAGQSEIKAAVGAISGAATLTVSPLTSIDITPANPSVNLVGTSQQFNATGHLQDGNTQDLTNLVTWNSSNTGFATISATGSATGQSAGNTNITASFGGVPSNTVIFTVASLQSIAIAPANASVDAGVNQQFNATGTLSNAETRDVTNLVTWNSSSASVASIDNAGVASTLLPGSTTITATYHGVTSSTTLTVLAPNSITVTPANPSGVSGTTQQFQAIGNFDDGTHDLTNVVTWSSSVPSAATISNANGSRGLATLGTNPLPTFIIATLGAGGAAVSGSTSLTVKALTALTVTGSSTVSRGSVSQLKAVATFSNLSTQDVTSSATWSSDQPGVAPVGNISGTKGQVQGLALGSANITAAIGSFTSPRFPVTVSTTPVTPPSNQAFVTEFGLNRLSIINTATNQSLAQTIPVGTGPRRVALDTAANRAYVTNSGSNTVSVVDLAAQSVIGTIPVGASPFGLALVPATNRAYVVNKFGGTVSVISTSTNTVVTNFAVGASPEDVAVNSSTNRIYVTNTGANTVSVLNATTGAVIATIQVGAAPHGIALSSSGNLAYVANGNSNTVSVINTSTNQVTATITVGNNPQRIAINGNRAYVANFNSSTVSVVSTDTNTVLTTLSAGFSNSGPLALAVRASTGRLYSVNNSSNTVTVFDTSNNGLVAGIPVGAGPTDIAVLP